MSESYILQFQPKDEKLKRFQVLNLGSVREKEKKKKKICLNAILFLKFLSLMLLLLLSFFSVF